MKLIFCKHCHDVLKLNVTRWRYCMCGETAGRYLPDGHRAQVSHDAVVIGIDNNVLAAAVRGGDSKKHPLTAWVFSRAGEDSKRIRWEKR